MNHSRIISNFLHWLASHKEITDWESGLKFYLRSNNIDYSEQDWKKLTKIVKSALRQLNAN